MNAKSNIRTKIWCQVVECKEGSLKLREIEYIVIERQWGVNENVNGREDLGWKYWDEQVSKDL